MTQLFGQMRESEDVVVRRIERRVSRYVDQVRAEGKRALEQAARSSLADVQFDDDAPTQILRARADSSAVAPPPPPPVAAARAPFANSGANSAAADQPGPHTKLERPAEKQSALVSPVPQAPQVPPHPPSHARVDNRNPGSPDAENRSRPPAPLSGLRRPSPGLSAAVSLSPSAGRDLRRESSSDEGPGGEVRFAQARKGGPSGGGGLGNGWTESPQAPADSLDDLFGSAFGAGDDDFSDAQSGIPAGVPGAVRAGAEGSFGQSARFGGVSPAEQQGFAPDEEPENEVPPRVLRGSGLLIIAFAAGVLVLIYFLITFDRYVY